MASLRADLAAARPTGPKGQQKSSVVPELAGQPSGVPGWSSFILPPERELNDQWVGRQRIETVEGMLNDSQVTSLRQAIRLPVHRYIIELDPQDCDPVAVDLIATDLDVALVGGEGERRTGRRADRFSSRRHLDRAMDALDYGHAVFEQAGRIDDAGYWRLVDLAPVPQWTISDQNSWDIDRHGRVIRVVQWGSTPPVKIPVDHLVTFTWQGRPGDPRGRSVLRPLFGSWVLRDRTMRVMGMSAERTGMGIPVGKVSSGAVAGAKEKMSSLLGQMASGHDTNLVLETDGDIRHEIMLMGVTGQTPNLVEMLRYHDESMARAMLAMLIQLGQTETGSRALGGTFDDLLSMFHDTVVDWYCDAMQHQLVERWIDRNREPVGGEPAPAPLLVWRRRDDEAAAEAEAIDGTADEVDEPAQLPAPVSARRRAGRPEVGKLATGQPANQRAKATRAAFATTTGRDLRRDPTDIELAAAADFATIEQQYVATRGNVTAAILAVRDQLTAVAVEQVEQRPVVDPLTLGDVLGPALDAQAADMDSAPLAALLVAFAVAGMYQVIGEAARQGASLEASIDYAERADADAADLMRRMARQVTESSASAARTGVPAGSDGQTAAQTISAHLASLTSAAAEQAAAGAVSRAQNAGRAAAIAAGEAIGSVTSVIASEALDVNTCSACLLVDGQTYSSLADALVDYPAGGFKSCDGRERCRGILLATFDTEAP